MINWCDYDSKEELYKGRLKNLFKESKVVQLSLNNIFIKLWNSIANAKIELNINCIYACCRNKQKTAGGFKWVYKEDYDEILLNKE